MVDTLHVIFIEAKDAYRWPPRDETASVTNPGVSPFVRLRDNDSTLLEEPQPVAEGELPETT